MDVSGARSVISRVAASRRASTSASASSSTSPTTMRVTSRRLRDRARFERRGGANETTARASAGRHSLSRAVRPTALNAEGEERVKEEDSGVSARLLLMCVPALWATYAPSLKYVFTSDVPPGPEALSFVRMALTQLPFIPALLSTLGRSASSSTEERTDAKRSIRAAVELGAYNAVATAFQAWGLEHTTSTHSGFIMGSVSVLVPALSVLSGDAVRRETWLACATTFIGVAIIGLDSVQSDSSLGSISERTLSGDVAVFVSAMCYAAMTLRASTYAREFSANDLMGMKTFVVLIFMTAWYARAFDSAGGAVDDASFAFLASPMVAAAVVYSAFAPGALASYIQLKGQGRVSAPEAQLVYAATPVFNAVVSTLALGETMTTNTLIGGGIILAASVSSFALPRNDA